MTPFESYYRLIPLTKNQIAIVDEELFPVLTFRKWQVMWNKGTQSFYAIRSVSKNGKKSVVYMHREVLGLTRGDGKQGDHINGNTLDNRKSNLRITDYEGNGKNRKVNHTSKSGIRGVWLHKCGSWTAQIGYKGKKIHLGMYPSSAAAKSAYVTAAQMLHGEFYTDR